MLVDFNEKLYRHDCHEFFLPDTMFLLTELQDQNFKSTLQEQVYKDKNQGRPVVHARATRTHSEQNSA